MNKINLENFCEKKYSQFGEDGITKKIFELIGTTNKVCVEFGVESGDQCCSRILWQDLGFKQILFDNCSENKNYNLKKYTITTDNVLNIFSNENVPLEPDFLSVDIDSYDFYVTHKILQIYSPRVLVVETNPTFLKENKVIKLNHPLNGGAYHGCSVKAWFLSLKDRYDFVAHETNGINAFFVIKGLLNEDVIENINDFEKLYRLHSGLHNYAGYPDSEPILTHNEALSLLN